MSTGFPYSELVADHFGNNVLSLRIVGLTFGCSLTFGLAIRFPVPVCLDLPEPTKCGLFDGSDRDRMGFMRLLVSALST